MNGFFIIKENKEASTVLSSTVKKLENGTEVGRNIRLRLVLSRAPPLFLCSTAYSVLKNSTAEARQRRVERQLAILLHTPHVSQEIIKRIHFHDFLYSSRGRTKTAYSLLLFLNAIRKPTKNHGDLQNF